METVKYTTHIFTHHSYRGADKALARSPRWLLIKFTS